METERLILRKAKTDDAEALQRIRNSEYVLKYNAMLPFDLDRTRKMIEEDMASDRVFYMESKETGALIGVVAVEEDSMRHRVPSCCLSYYMGEEFGGNGYMTEALRAVIRHCFSAFDVQVVSARVFSGNTASTRLLERLGFVHEGCVRKCVAGYKDIVYDDNLFSILKEEFAAQPCPLLL